jgi:hypothetical protein
MPWPKSSLQSAGRGGGDQSRWSMSHRTPVGLILQPTLPLGE